MTPWDSDKSTAVDPDNPDPDEQLTADEWDQHVTEGHWPGDELNLSINGNGDPVITDPQNGDQEVMRYDRSEGAWVVSSLNTKQIGNERHYAGAYPGADADARLGNALSAASNGDTIYLESASYTTSQTISGGYRIVGIRPCSLIESPFTFDDNQPTIVSVNIVGQGEIVFNTANCTITQSRFGTEPAVTDKVGDNSIFGCDGGIANTSIVLESGTSGSIVDACRNFSVTDNGTNTVGDIG